jgi:hypothetical protein
MPYIAQPPQPEVRIDLQEPTVKVGIVIDDQVGLPTYRKSIWLGDVIPLAAELKAQWPHG